MNTCDSDLLNTNQNNIDDDISMLQKENSNERRHVGKPMCKSRFKRIQDALVEAGVCDNNIRQNILNAILDIFEFDPNKSAYTKEYGQKQIESRKQKTIREGKSLYELYHKPYRHEKN